MLNRALRNTFQTTYPRICLDSISGSRQLRWEILNGSADFSRLCLHLLVASGSGRMSCVSQGVGIEISARQVLLFHLYRVPFPYSSHLIRPHHLSAPLKSHQVKRWGHAQQTLPCQPSARHWVETARSRPFPPSCSLSPTRQGTDCSLMNSQKP